MDLILAIINSVFVYIDHILLVTKGTKQQHVNKVKEVLRILDVANLQLRNCAIVQENIERLGYKLTRTSIYPINAKAQGISEMLPPTNLKQLRSFLGAVNQFKKLYQILRQSVFSSEQFWKTMQIGYGTKITTTQFKK